MSKTEITILPGAYSVLVSTSVAQFISGFAQSAVLLAIPTLGNFFKASFVDVIWLSTGSLLASAILQAAFGKIADVSGKKRVASWGLILFILSSLLSAFSPNIVFLIFAQVINGIGRAALSAVGTALLAASFPSTMRGRILGINTMAIYAGLGFGPPIAGALIEWLGWRSLFYLPALVCVPAFLMIQMLVREPPLVKKTEGSFDFYGAITFSFFLLALMMIITGVTPNYNIIFGPVCLVCFVSFILIERKAPNPLIDLLLFRRNRTFVIGNVSNFLNYLPSNSYIFVLSIYLQIVVGYSPVVAGAILFLPRFVMMIVVPISGAISDRISSRIVGSSGMLIRSIGFVFCGFLSAGFPVQYIWIPLVLIGIGQGSFSAPNQQIVMNSVPPDKFGMASGTLGTMTSTALTAGVGFVGAIIAAAMPAGGYAQISSASDPSTVPASLLHLYVVGMDESFLLLAVLLLFGMVVYLPRDKKSRQYQAAVSS